MNATCWSTSVSMVLSGGTICSMGTHLPTVSSGRLCWIEWFDAFCTYPNLMQLELLPTLCHERLIHLRCCKQATGLGWNLLLPTPRYQPFLGTHHELNDPSGMGRTVHTDTQDDYLDNRHRSSATELSLLAFGTCCWTPKGALYTASHLAFGSIGSQFSNPNPQLSQREVFRFHGWTITCVHAQNQE